MIPISRPPGAAKVPPCPCGSGRPAYFRYVDGKPVKATCCDLCWAKHPLNPDRVSPMMQMYDRIKAQLPTRTILLFKLGDFHEAFGDDAVTIASALDMSITRRSGRPMPGVPSQHIANYCRQLMAAGHKVAITDPTQETNETTT